MKIRAQKGFSLAEVMIAMIVISIALSAAIPTITKRNAGSDNIWRVGVDSTGAKDDETLAYTGPNLMIGASRLPMLSGFYSYFTDERFATKPAQTKFYPKNDKLILFKTINHDYDRFKSSHIGFYNDNNDYAGRLASDKYNLALGIGTLQSLQPNYTDLDNLQGAYNTAIGHYALFTNVQGSYNTAYGYNALRGNHLGNYNNNIAVGDNALKNINGDNNIAVGSHAGEYVTGSNNILLGVNAGGDARDNNIIIGPSANADYNILRLMTGDNRPANITYPVPSYNDNFVLGSMNTNGTVSPPIMQGYLKTEYGNKIGCVDGICHAKGLIINTENFYLNTRGKETLKNSSTNEYAVDEHPKPILAIRTTTENNAVDISQATVMPCGGAPICLAPFKVTTASFYTKQEQDAPLGNNYDRKSTYPRFKDATVNNTGLPDNPIYDLYIGSIFASNSAFSAENNKTLKGYDHDHTQYSINLIDVGKQENTDGLELSRLSDEIANNVESGNFDDAQRPAILEKSNSLKIRTVKTAVNFLDEMKEKSGLTDRIRDNADYNLKSLFTYPANTTDTLKYSTNCNTSGEKSDWESIKSCDFEKYMENGRDLLAGFCEYVWERRNERNQRRINYENCRKVPHTILYCLIDTIFGDATTDDDKEEDAATAYARQQCEGKVIGYLTCLAKEKKNYVPPEPEPEPTPETSDTTTDTTTDSTIETTTTDTTTESDARLKNIAGDNTAGLKEINKLQVYNYTYKADKAKTPHVGVIAQDLKKVFPNAVRKGSDGYYRIRLEDIFYAMINSVKELSKKKDELDTLTEDYIDIPLSELDKQNADIKAQNELLKQKNAEIEKRLSQFELK